MGLFRGLFARKQPQESERLRELRVMADDNLALLGYLMRCAKFDRASMGTYVEMIESQSGELDPIKKSQMLRANEVMVPKLQNGRVIDGFEQLRQSFVEVHIEALSMIIKLVKSLPPQPASAELLQHTIGEVNRIRGPQ